MNDGTTNYYNGILTKNYIENDLPFPRRTPTLTNDTTHPRKAHKLTTQKRKARMHKSVSVDSIPKNTLKSSSSKENNSSTSENIKKKRRKKNRKKKRHSASPKVRRKVTKEKKELRDSQSATEEELTRDPKLERKSSKEKKSNGPRRLERKHSWKDLKTRKRDKDEKGLRGSFERKRSWRDLETRKKEKEDEVKRDNSEKKQNWKDWEIKVKSKGDFQAKRAKSSVEKTRDFRDEKEVERKVSCAKKPPPPTPPSNNKKKKKTRRRATVGTATSTDVITRKRTTEMNESTSTAHRQLSMSQSPPLSRGRSPSLPSLNNGPLEPAECSDPASMSTSPSKNIETHPKFRYMQGWQTKELEIEGEHPKEIHSSSNQTFIEYLNYKNNSTEDCFGRQKSKRKQQFRHKSQEYYSSPLIVSRKRVREERSASSEKKIPSFNIARIPGWSELAGSSPPSSASPSPSSPSSPPSSGSARKRSVWMPSSFLGRDKNQKKGKSKSMIEKPSLDPELIDVLEELDIVRYRDVLQEDCITYKMLYEYFDEDDFNNLQMPLGPRITLCKYFKRKRAMDLVMTRSQEKIRGKRSADTLVANISIHELTFKKLLGTGVSGEVYKGKLRGTTVAIKLLKTFCFQEFLKEASIMKNLDNHPNIVGFYGLSKRNDGTLCIVTEFVHDGGLDKFLRRNIDNIPPKQLLTICKKVAAGMDHLEKNKLVHRDLAARNVLIEIRSEGKYNIKVCDFGLSREVEDYYEMKDSHIAVRWSSPESLQYKKFTHASDVWSFGVTMWEIFSYGAEPYPGLSNTQVIEAILNKDRPPKPKQSTPSVYSLMQDCWKEENERPSFLVLFKSIRAILQESYAYISSDTSEQSSSDESATDDEPQTEITSGGYI
eukprot:CAMPEP_0174260100 /NCGR_PEP_ID=MMETSP0439-20130205/8839_1 /TAXON_ID=0 /ORGANISM="Stereomyxa ramosa, Strain Chinc5" /LENGTH=882 /DNA_ID=CAMNT_0015344257 /DNA_START=631 /DNA_END=3279 /DNA_ORIENTATION=-